MNCLGIGKIIYDSVDNEWNFPHFHFVIFQESTHDTIFAYCMELCIEQFADNFDSAVRNLVNSCNSYIEEVLKEGVDTFFDQLRFFANGRHNDKLWQVYRNAEINLAHSAQDLGNSYVKELRNEIKRLMRENLELKATNFTLDSINLLRLTNISNKESQSQELA